MLNFIRGLFESRKKALLRAKRWEKEAKFWRRKYENAKRYIEDIHDDIHSYE